jgi:ATP-binding cassette subfamily F protein uup
MAPPLLTLSDIALTFGSTPLIENANLMVYPRERLCLVGRNGSGKSTLMKIAAELVEADKGDRFVKPGTSWRYLPQEPDLSAFATSRDYIVDGLVGADDGGRIPYLLDALGLSGEENPQVMSGGEMRRAALARTLAPNPDILMLDEPTNHLDLPAIEWLEDELGRSQSAIILISHDRRFLERLSNRTVWMDRGETRELDKGFAHFEDWRDDFLEQEELDRHKMERQVHREQHWVVHGVSGRRKRNVRRLKELGQLRDTIKNQRQVKGNAQITVTEAQSSSKQIVKLNNVSHAFGERSIVSDLSLKINRGERLGLVGPNGAGKTTLLKIIMGELIPDEGEVKLGLNLEPLVIDQKRESLNPEWTLKDALTDGGSDTVMVGEKPVHVMRYMKDFLFLPEQARTPLHALSGGERGRLQLARGLRLPSNFLVLDEPTNDLDLETLDLLQEMVANYHGTVIIVSHDRDFLDRTVTRTLAYEGPGQWQIYAGGYSDMIAQRGVGVKARKKAKDSLKSETVGQSETTAPKKSSSKLSYKHKFRLEQLPKEMETLSKTIAKLGEKLSDPEFYNKDPEGFAKSSKALEDAQAQLEYAEEEWLELEMLREAAES